NIRQYAADIIGKLEPVYGAIANGDIEEDDLLGSGFNQWWGREWQRIKKDFDVWYAESIQGRKEADALGAEHQELAALHAAYDEKIDDLLTNLTTGQTDELKRIYTAGRTISMPDPREGNYKIREELFREIQQKFETELTDQLAQSLQVLIDQIVQKTQALLWETDDVRKTLLNADESIEQARIRHGFQVLFLRFGRVAVEAFIAKPLQARERLLSERSAEIKTLEAFYQGADPNKQDVTHYLRYGLWANKAVPPSAAVKAVKTAVKQDAVTEPNPAKKISEEQEKLPEPNNFEQVVEEINGDLSALKEYLKNSVFYAAGFVTYCNQELERIRNRFKEMEDNDRQWIGLIRTAVKYEKNPNIPYNIAHSRRDFRMRREIALELKEVRESYAQVY
ncbi:MAG: dynamin family protein, partial [Methylobacter sp.]